MNKNKFVKNNHDKELASLAGLSNAQFKTLKMFFLKHLYKEYTVAQLRILSNLDRTTIQKQIKILLDNGYIKRRKVNFDCGGYYYKYRMIDFEFLRTKILNEQLDRSSKVINYLETLRHI